VGSDDVLRRLSLIPVVELMTPLRAATDGRSGLIAIDRSENARNALSLLLREGVRAVAVTDGQTVIGSLTIHDLEAALQEARPAEEKPA
jgi:CBS domain-containing protein